jgi:hypothetical protein
LTGKGAFKLKPSPRMAAIFVAAFDLVAPFDGEDQASE